MTARDTECKYKKTVQRLAILICTILTIGTTHVFSQSGTEIPIGTWRAHLSYHKLIAVAIGDTFIYGASDMGVLVLNRADNSMTTLNKLNGLSSSGISHITYDNASQQLLITYEDGNIDIVHDHTVTNFSRLRDLNTIVGSKKINHAIIREKLAYLSTDYGVVVFNLEQQELKETWRDLGRNGETLSISKLAVLNDSIVAATEKGLMIGSLNDNLLDFNKWKRFDSGDFAGKIDDVTIFNGKIYAAVNSKGIYHYENNTFIQDPFLQGETFQSLEGSATNLLIAEADNLWQLKTDGQLIQIADDEITYPLMSLQDETAVLWIADANNGLVSNVDGVFNNYLPNGPILKKASRLKYHDNKIYALHGGFALSGDTTVSKGVVAYFENGLWKTLTTPLTNVTDIEFSGKVMYTGSFGDGLMQSENEGSSIIYDNSNSPLENTNPAGKAVNITALDISDAGLWVANFGASQSLHLLKMVTIIEVSPYFVNLKTIPRVLCINI